MIPAVRAKYPRQMLVGAAFGLYAALAALAPGWGGKALLCAPRIVIPLAWFILRTTSGWLALFLAGARMAPPLPSKLGDSGPHIALLFAAAGLWIGLARLSEWRAPARAAGMATLAAITAAAIIGALS